MGRRLAGPAAFVTASTPDAGHRVPASSGNRTAEDDKRRCLGLREKIISVTLNYSQPYKID
jgi:hypothetical protein